MDSFKSLIRAENEANLIIGEQQEKINRLQELIDTNNVYLLEERDHVLELQGENDKLQVIFLFYSCLKQKNLSQIAARI